MGGGGLGVEASREELYQIFYPFCSSNLTAQDQI